VAQVWILLLGDSPAKLIKVAGLWSWVHRCLVRIRVHLYQTLVAPLLAGGIYLGLCALGMLAVRRATLAGKVGLTTLDVAVVAVCVVLVLRRRVASPASLVQDRWFNTGLLLVILAVLVALVWLGNEFYYVSLVMTLVVFLPVVLYFPLLGLLGGWDAHGLEQFALAAGEAGLAYALYYPAYELSARLCRRSRLYNRFPIPHTEAQAEAEELDQLRVEKTYRLSQQI
jgi:hypothetical protein